MNGRLVIVGAVVAILAMTTAAIMFTTGDSALERLGLLLGLVGPTIIGLMALLRADKAAVQTEEGSKIARSLDGGLDARLRAAVRDVRNEPDATITPASDRGGPDEIGEPNRPQP